MLSSENRLGWRLYMLSNEATKSPSKKNWKVMSFPSFQKNRRRQPFRIKYKVSATCPSSSSRVLAGTTSGVIRSFSRIIEMIHLTNRHEDSNFNLLYVHQPLEEFTGTRNIERNTNIA